MSQRTVPVGLLLAILFPSVLAAHVDGVNLVVTPGVASSVQLDWSGGQPAFQIYRSTFPGSVVSAANLIGETSVRAWSDEPGPGGLFFYMITSSCQYNPPETCDGLDNDCNGTIDGPGSEVSCNVPNAVPQCVGGGCAIAGCLANFGDCDSVVSNGCENDLTASPDCGTCGNDCDSGLGVCQHSTCSGRVCQAPFDNSRCLAPTGNTTSAGHCAFAQAGCATAVDTDGDGLGDTWEDAGAIDLNCDGVYDSSDVVLPNADKRVKDVYLKISYMAQSPHTYPPIIVCSPVNTEPPTGHKPQQESVDWVVRAFSGAHLTPAAEPCGMPGDASCTAGFTCVDFACLPNCTADSECSTSCNNDCQAKGGARCVAKDGGAGNVCRLWRLHVDQLPAAGVPHHDIVSYGPVTDACANTTGGGSGTPGDKADYYDYKSSEFDPKAAAFKHFILFGHDNTCYGHGSPGCGSCPAPQPAPGTSGVSEIKGNDSIVSLGMNQAVYSGAERIQMEAGALMHELGHNLGLDHGGPAGVPSTVWKINYISSMNPIYQSGIPFTDFPGGGFQASSHPDYSHTPLTLALDECNLSDVDGVGLPGLQEPSSKALIKYWQDTSSGACGFCPDDRCGVPQTSCFLVASGTAFDGQMQPIDWGCDGSFFEIGASADLNGNSIFCEVHDPAGTADWINLFFEFQCQTAFSDRPVVEPGMLAAADSEGVVTDLMRASSFPRAGRLAVSRPELGIDGTRIIPAILFGSPSLDVRKIKPSTLRLEGAGPIGESLNFADYDGDGHSDLKAIFRPDRSSIPKRGAFVYVTGILVDGTTFNAVGANPDAKH